MKLDDGYTIKTDKMCTRKQYWIKLNPHILPYSGLKL